MGFSRQENWSGLPFPSPGDLPDPGMESSSPALEADYWLSHKGSLISLTASGGQSIEVSVSVLPVSIQGLFSLGLTGLISLLSKGLSKSLHKHHSSKASILWHSAFSYGSALTTIALLEKSYLWLYRLLSAKWCLCFLVHYVCYSFSSREQASFNFMAAVIGDNYNLKL